MDHHAWLPSSLAGPWPVALVTGWMDEKLKHVSWGKSLQVTALANLHKTPESMD